MTSNNADQANHKDSNKEKEKKHDSGEIIFLSKGSNRHFSCAATWWQTLELK